MRNKRLASLTISLALILSLAPVALYAQASENRRSDVEQLRTSLQKHEVRIQGWEKTANIIIGLTLTVGILGVIVGLLQGLQKNWCKTATVVIGAAISIITLVNNTLFPDDYRVLRQKALQGSEILSDFEKVVASGPPQGDDDRNAWLDECKKFDHQLYELELEELHQGVRNSSNLNLIPPVYAAPHADRAQKPAWIAKPPTDQNNLYFLGEGVDKSLEKAREASHTDAISRATAYFSRSLGGVQQTQVSAVDLNALSGYLVKSAETAGTFFDYENDAWHYYTLLRLHREILETDLKFWELERRKDVPQGINAAVQTVQAPVNAYPAPAGPPASPPAKLAEKHVQNVAGLPADLLVFLGDIDHNKPVQMVVFRADPSSGVRAGVRISYPRLKSKLRPGNIVLDKKISNGEKVPVQVGGQPSLWQVNLHWAALGEKYALLTIASR